MLFEKIKLEEDEQILLLVRRHWFVFLLRVFGVISMALAPFIVIALAATQEVTADLLSSAFLQYGDQLFFLGALWLLVAWMSLAFIWTDQYLDIWVITDRRIIAIDQVSLFVRSIGSFRLERLQDMNVIIPGFLATMFDYGHVDAQTASGSEGEFHARFLPKPREIKSLILEAADQRMKQVSGSYVQEMRSGM